MVTSDLADGARFAELASWSQAERDLAAETIYRFVFRSLYEAHAFNGDPHPGNYLFHGGGRVTFLDFGLVKHFSDEELQPLVAMVRHLCVENDPEAFRRAMEDAGFLMPGRAAAHGHDRRAHGRVLRHGARAGTADHDRDYASAVTRRFFDFRSPLAAYVQIPRSYVILQRINLGLFALLGELSATADWRGIAEEIWPFVQGPRARRWGRPRPSGEQPGRGQAPGAFGTDLYFFLNVPASGCRREQVERPEVPGRAVAGEGRRGRDDLPASE